MWWLRLCRLIVVEFFPVIVVEEAEVVVVVVVVVIFSKHNDFLFPDPTLIFTSPIFT